MRSLSLQRGTESINSIIIRCDMKEQSDSHVYFKNSFSRRKFLRRAATAAVGLSFVPRHVLGGPGHVPPSEKINVAFIGVGAQGLRVMLGFLRQPDVQG